MKETMPARKILIVDDVEDSLLMMEYMLSLQGYDVITAPSVDAAIVQARQELPDLIITDLGMPEKDGFDLLKLIRQDQRLATIPTIALSGYTNSAEVERVKAAGFTAHLPKPVEEEDLLRVIRDCQEAKSPGA